MTHAWRWPPWDGEQYVISDLSLFLLLANRDQWTFQVVTKLVIVKWDSSKFRGEQLEIVTPTKTSKRQIINYTLFAFRSRKTSHMSFVGEVSLNPWNLLARKQASKQTTNRQTDSRKKEKKQKQKQKQAPQRMTPQIVPNIGTPKPSLAYKSMGV